MCVSELVGVGGDDKVPEWGKGEEVDCSELGL